MPEAAVDTNTIQAAENALVPEQSSGDKSLIPPTPTPQPGETTPTLPGDTPTEAVTQATPASPTAVDQPPIGADGKPASTPAWVQRRIDKLTAEKHDARRETEAALIKVKASEDQAAALLASLAELRASSGNAPAVQPAAPAAAVTPAVQPAVAAKSQIPMAEAEIEARATAKAAEMSRVNTFNKACNDIADAGKTEYTDFDSAIKNFNMLGGIPTQMLETLTEMPNAHKILYAVGKDPELAEKVMKMPPMKMAMELARLEQGLQKPGAVAPISGAPRPITPIDTTGRAEPDLEKMSMEQFVEYRQKNKKSRW